MRRLPRTILYFTCITSTLFLAATLYSWRHPIRLVLFKRYEFSTAGSRITLNSDPQVPQFEARLKTARKAQDLAIEERRWLLRGSLIRPEHVNMLTREEQELMTAIATETQRLEEVEQRARDQINQITRERDRATFRWSQPHWIFTLSLAVTSALALTPILRACRKPKPGHCPHCNYDLRATPTRCPECGATISPRI